MSSALDCWTSLSVRVGHHSSLASKKASLRELQGWGEDDSKAAAHTLLLPWELLRFAGDGV